MSTDISTVLSINTKKNAALYKKNTIRYEFIGSLIKNNIPETNFKCFYEMINFYNTNYFISFTKESSKDYFFKQNTK